MTSTAGHSSSNRMLKLIWPKGHQPSAERLKVQKDLFAFHKDVKHGFPNKPTAVAWDNDLRLLAVANKQGALRMVGCQTVAARNVGDLAIKDKADAHLYGKAGVEYYSEHESDVIVTQMIFLPGQGRLITLTEDNFLHLWEMNDTSLKELKSAHLDGRLKKVSVLCLDPELKFIYLGTEGGNIYHLNLKKFCVDENIIYQDIVMKGAPDDFKVNPGAVEALLVQPNEPGRLLIGYARGLIVLWDRSNSVALQTFVASQQLESLAWRNDGSQFVSAHNDGSYMVWSTQGSVEPLEPPNTPYGPYPCKAITKVLWAHDNGASWLIFGGGMPRTTYGDKFTVTVMKGEDKHTVFDVSSKIIDFCLVFEQDSTSTAPTSLIIIAEEELMVVDIKDDAWPVHSVPYLNSVHASAITCLSHADDVDEDVLKRIVETKHLGNAKVSTNAWPINGGQVANERQTPGRELLLTGHEDGSVKIWNCSDVALSHLITVKTNRFFEGDDHEEPPGEEEDEHDWPPFRKIGHFDPYSDDPRLAVKKISFCGKSGKVVIGGTAGQVVVCDIAEQATERTLKMVKCDLVTEKEGFTWKGHSSLKTRTESIKLDKGYQPSLILQTSPPASINSLACSTTWGLVAAGTAHGLVILDTVVGATIYHKCTLNAQDIANADDNPMSRRKSLKKSLRESFRRLRKGRSQRNVEKKRIAGSSDPIKRELRSESPEARPVERQVEARSGSEDGMGSMVRCLHFAKTFIANPHSQSATLWAGTNSGQILIFLLTVTAGSEKRKTEKASAILAKEIQLKHKAPVIAIEVIDSHGLPVTTSGDSTGSGQVPHKVLIVSEEQFKTFLLPTLKPCGKYKLTAHEGSRIRRIGFTTFVSKADENYFENCLTCLTNQGDLAIHSLPDLKRQTQTNAMKKEDVMAISSLVFSPQGEAFFMCSSSEFQRVSLAASRFLKPQGTVDFINRVSLDDGSASAEDDVVRQNKQNELKASTSTESKKAEETNPDVHNETTVSEVSGDITLDSVRDHTLQQQTAEMTIMERTTSTSSTTRVERTTEVTETTQVVNDDGVVNDSGVVSSGDANVVVTKSTTIVTKEPPNSTENEASRVNGIAESFESATIQNAEDESDGAPLASLESAGSELQSIVSTESSQTKRQA